jgi:GTP-binding protein
MLETRARTMKVRGKSPTVALVGAPNVGKSRLFNRLTGSRSIVHDRPGVTRDRIEAICEWNGRQFRLFDTGGLVPGDRDELTRSVERQVLRGVQEADLVVFVVDGKEGLTVLDQALGKVLRVAECRVLLAVNKVDTDGQEGRAAEFYKLGFAGLLAISAEQGRGIAQLLDRILELLPLETPEETPDPATPAAIRLAIVGRPNVGKSTLFNRLTGEERAVVSSVPGTTRDPVDAEFVHRRRRYTVVDTAGLRRKARVEGESVEVQSVERAFATIRGADIILAVLDATEAPAHQDLAVIGECLRLRRPLIVVLNKMDKVRADEVDATVQRAMSALHFGSEIPVLPVSALRGSGAGSVLAMLDSLSEECARKVPTARLNAALESAVRLRSPSSRDKVPRLFYITQTGGFPPSFVVFTNGARIAPAYSRFLMRHLRKSLGFDLAPLALKFRRRP